MKKIVVVFVVAVVLFGSCAPKPYYMTKEGKKKQRYYNDLQYGKDKHPKKTF